MDKEGIKKELIDIFGNLTKDFPSIEIRYEFSERYECFLSSINTSSLSAKDLDAFCTEYLEEINLIQNKYGEDAPLFCLNEEWFKLTDKALSYSNIDIIKEVIEDLEWTDFIEDISLNVAPQPVHLMEYKEVGEMPLAA